MGETKGYAVQLYFDAGLEAELTRLRSAMTRAGVTPTLERLGARPHLSLAVLDPGAVPNCIPMLEDFARTRPRFPVAIAAFGAFPTAQGVVYLSPAPSARLLDTHRSMYQRLLDLGAQVHEHYAPGGWVPHVTIGFELPGPEVSLALSWLYENFKPLDGILSSVGLIEFRPVQELAAFDLRP